MWGRMKITTPWVGVCVRCGNRIFFVVSQSTIRAKSVRGRHLKERRKRKRGLWADDPVDLEVRDEYACADCRRQFEHVDTDWAAESECPYCGSGDVWNVCYSSDEFESYLRQRVRVGKPRLYEVRCGFTREES